ncbi:MAG TPA: hypothetical protein VGO89_17325 [Streptomyces sp.]|jgi:hypothetical protein|nr:hypothetical protein [Streptomyces sp.]
MDPESRGHDTDGEGEQESWEEFVLDEEFVRGAEVNEPAARTRMLRERWRREPPEPQPWRADEPPAGWFFSKSRRRSRKWRRDQGD